MKSRTQQFLEALRRLDDAEQTLRGSADPQSLVTAAEEEVEAMDALDRLFQASYLNNCGKNCRQDQVEAA